MNKFLIFFLIFCLFIGLDMFVLEPNLMILKNEKLFIPNWEKGLDGFKIGIVADLHIGTRFVDLDKVYQVVQKINSQNPDLIVLLGDIDAKSITYNNYKKEDVANTLKLLKAKYGTVTIMGNHDYEPPNIVREIFQRAGIPILENQDFYIYPSSQKIRIIGFKDLWHFKSIPINIIGTKQKNIPTIVLAHNPDSFADMPNFVSLTLCGHTHGGETVFPVIGSFAVPSIYGQRYRKGYIVENNKHLYVSGGVATTSRMRFLNPPEITTIELYAQNSNNKIENTKPLKGINKNYAPFVIPKLRKIINKINNK